MIIKLLQNEKLCTIYKNRQMFLTNLWILSIYEKETFCYYNLVTSPIHFVVLFKYPIRNTFSKKTALLSFLLFRVEDSKSFFVETEKERCVCWQGMLKYLIFKIEVNLKNIDIWKYWKGKKAWKDSWLKTKGNLNSCVFYGFSLWYFWEWYKAI